MRRSIIVLPLAACVCLILFRWATHTDGIHPDRFAVTDQVSCIDCHHPAAGERQVANAPVNLPPGHPPTSQIIASAAPGSGAGAVGEDRQGDRLAYDLLRFRDPETGRIPPDMRRRELAFAEHLPVNLRHAGAHGEKVAGWASRGPHHVGGRVRALAVDLADPTYRTLFAAGVSGGLWRSTDDGLDWTLLTPPNELHSISCIAQDPRPGHRNVWYYGTGEGKGSTSEASRTDSRDEGWGLHGNGVYKSTDGGLSWNLLPATSSGTPTVSDSRWDYVWKIVVDPSETVLDEVYAAAYGVVFRSVDGGETWAAVLGDEVDPSKFADVVVADDGTVYAGIGADGAVRGIHRSTDGVTWTDITPTPWNAHTRIVLALAPSDQTLLYVTGSEVDGTYMTSLHRYTYLSGDGSGAGGSWQDRLAYVLQLPHDALGSWPLYTQRGYNQCTAVNPLDPDVVFLGAVNMWRSTNGFNDFNGSAFVGGWLYDGHHADVHQIVYRPGSTNVIYTASDGGVHRCDDANAVDPVWTSLNNGLITTQYYTVAIDEQQPGSDIVVAGTQDNGTHWTNSASPTATWLEPLGGDGSTCHVIDAAAGEYYLSYYRANIFHMVLDPAGGELSRKRVDPDTDDYFMFMNPFEIDPGDERIMYLAGPNGIWRNTNIEGIPAGNDDPTLVNWGRLTNEPVGENVTALAASDSPARILYYGPTDGSICRLDGANTAPDGSTPVRLEGNAAFPAGFVSSIAIDPLDDQRVLVAFSNYGVSNLWLTEDGGANWSEVEGNLGGPDSPSALCACIVPAGQARLYFVGTSTGLYSTTMLDGSATVWTREAPDLMGNILVEDLAARPADGLLVAATHGRGIYSVNISPLTATPDTPGALESPYLAQNTPNPFNPSTRIGFQLPRAGRAMLEIFDARGRPVRHLLDAQVDAAPQQVRWNGDDDLGRPVAAGTYVVRLRSGGHVASRKMSLVK